MAPNQIFYLTTKEKGYVRAVPHDSDSLSW